MTEVQLGSIEDLKQQLIDNRSEKSAKAKKVRSRNWCFTDFENLNYEKVYSEYSDIIRYICYGVEICPKTKKTHNQGWIQFKNPKRMTRVKKILGSTKIHLENCRGSEFQNETYCKKDGDFYCWGSFVSQGQRTDLELIHKQIKNGATKQKIIDDNFETYCRYRNGINDAIQIYTKINTRKFRHVDVEYIHGETGTGKTRKAMTKDLNCFKIQGTSLNWFDGYCGENTLVIDEYANDVKVTRLLSILDGYQLRLPVKGGFTYANWTKVIITSNLDPSELHFQANDKHKAALFRRITSITHLQH